MFSSHPERGGAVKSIRAATLIHGPRHLCLVPRRRVRRAAYVRPGRTLHVVDFENICGGPELAQRSGAEVAASYRRVAGLMRGDHVIAGSNPGLLFHCRDCFPGARLVGGHGPDGADRALLGAVPDVEWVAPRFDRVVIASGDHCFVHFAATLKARGIIVGVVARAGAVAISLRRAVCFVRALPEYATLQVVA